MLVKIDGELFICTHKEYDNLLEAYIYYVRDEEEPYCDLDFDIEEIKNASNRL